MLDICDTSSACDLAVVRHSATKWGSCRRFNLKPIQAVGIERGYSLVNYSDFISEISSFSYSQKVDSSFLVKWFQGTLSKLEELHKQQSIITHPRHRGDAREDGFVEIISSMIPSNLKTAKGYAVNKHAAKSREQDLLILNGMDNSCLIKTNSIGYYPIESVLASVEIKSNLNLPELRKSLVNCASLKALTRHPFDKEKDEKTRIFCSIFAYDSAKELKSLSDDLNKLCNDIPPHLRPNAFYILGKGALIPAADKTFCFDHSQFFTNHMFAQMEGIGTKAIPVSEASAFLYFAGGLIDHCRSEGKLREAPSLMSYLSVPFIFQHQVEEIMEKNKKIKQSEEGLLE